MGWQETWEREWPIMRSAPFSFLICLLAGLLIGAISVHLLYAYFVIPGKDSTIGSLNTTIDSLKLERDNLKDTQNNKPITKQDIRTSLESINSEILRKIDAGQKKLLISINNLQESKLINLAEKIDAQKFFKIRKFNHDDNGTDTENVNIYINDTNDISWKELYYLTPKDALIK